LVGLNIISIVLSLKKHRFELNSLTIAPSAKSLKT